MNLRGYDPGPPLAAGQALDGFLRALNVSGENIPRGMDEQAALYRSLLASSEQPSRSVVGCEVPHPRR